MTTAQDLLPILEKLKTVTVLTIGDVMLDQFVYGEVTRISPEAPVPVLRVRRRSFVAGGVGNVAANLCGLGANVRLVSIAGADAARTTLNKVLADLPGLSVNILTDQTRPTIQKDRYIAAGQQMLRVDDESTDNPNPAFEADLIAACRDAAAGCDAIIVSDYGKGVVTDGLLQAVFALGLPVFVDPKGRDYARYKGAALVTPNRAELADATGLPASSDTDIVAACKKLLDLGIRAVLATRSGDGMTLVDGKNNPAHLRAQAREVYDVSGAGDTVIATAAAAVAAGASLVQAAALANIAGGLIVEKVGTAAIRESDLRKFLSEDTRVIDLVQGNESGRTIAPVYDWQEAREQIERWRARGLKIGFTNGCFDLVHQGHVTMLDKCRRHCDRLVLGLNSDDSVSRLKGPTRPVNRQDARAQVVAALGSVDAVVLFGDNPAENDTPLDLIKALKPDLIFKGADYTPETVVGADFVQSYGGRVVLIDLEEGFSTTGTIKKLGAA